MAQSVNTIDESDKTLSIGENPAEAGQAREDNEGEPKGYQGKKRPLTFVRQGLRILHPGFSCLRQEKAADKQA